MGAVPSQRRGGGQGGRHSSSTRRSSSSLLMPSWSTTWSLFQQCPSPHSKAEVREWVAVAWTEWYCVIYFPIPFFSYQAGSLD